MGPSFFFQGMVFLGLNNDVSKNFNSNAGAFLGFLVWGAMHLLGYLNVLPGFGQFHFKKLNFWFYQAFVWAACIVFALMSNLSDDPEIDPTKKAPFYFYGIFFVIQAFFLRVAGETFWAMNVNLNDYADGAKDLIVDMSAMAMWGPSCAIGAIWINNVSDGDYSSQAALPVAIVSLLFILNMLFVMYGPSKFVEKYAIKLHAQILYVSIFVAQTVVFFLAVAYV